MARFTKTDLLVMYTDVQEGIDKNITTDTMIDGVLYTPPKLKGVFADAVTAIQGTANLLERYHDAVVVEHAAEALAATTYELLRDALIAQHGKQANAILGDFGMVIPKKPGAKTVAAKAAAIANRALTREVRHTMGVDQKKALTGRIEVPNPSLTPTPAPAAAATPAATKTEAK